MPETILARNVARSLTNRVEKVVANEKPREPGCSAWQPPRGLVAWPTGRAPVPEASWKPAVCSGGPSRHAGVNTREAARCRLVEPYGDRSEHGIGGPCGIRTHDQPIKSRPLCH